MVKIINAHTRKGERGHYVSLELQGSVEIVQSQNTGRFYVTARRCFIGSTLDIETARQSIGSQLPGNIVRVKTDPYEYALPESGEMLTLEHSYQYVPDESLMQQTHNAEQEVM